MQKAKVSSEIEQVVANLVLSVKKSGSVRKSPPKNTPKPWSRQRLEQWLKREQQQQSRRHKSDHAMKQIQTIISAYHAAVLRIVSPEQAAVIRYLFDEKLVAIGYERRINL